MRTALAVGASLVRTQERRLADGRDQAELFDAEREAMTWLLGTAAWGAA